MEPKFQSSFIPKGPLATSGSVAGIQPKRSLVGFLAKAIFVITLILALAVVGYKFYLRSDINKMGADLEAAKAKLDPNVITEISNLNTRIVSTQTLLQNHVVLSPFFDFLQESTLKTVRFNDMAYISDEKGTTMLMHGQAKGYAAVSLQSDAFSKTKYFKNPVFSNLDLDNKGNVVFTFTATVDPSIISYKTAIEGGKITVPRSLTGTTTPAVTGTSTPATVQATSTKPVATTTPKTATSTPVIKR
ncbi:MAG: protein of unknown function with transrane region [Parcubacteria group bacterium]|nr:protein of unknown function with transrane region [Parcubacteria group bacterium]